MALTLYHNDSTWLPLGLGARIFVPASVFTVACAPLGSLSSPALWLQVARGSETFCPFPTPDHFSMTLACTAGKQYLEYGGREDISTGFT